MKPLIALIILCTGALSLSGCMVAPVSANYPPVRYVVVHQVPPSWYDQPVPGPVIVRESRLVPVVPLYAYAPYPHEDDGPYDSREEWRHHQVRYIKDYAQDNQFRQLPQRERYPSVYREQQHLLHSPEPGSGHQASVAKKHRPLYKKILGKHF